jgi:ACS family hexuronate transporter-like MFS transporter
MHETGRPPFNRWILFVFLTAAGVLALVDRQIIAVLKPAMSAELGWTDNDYASLGACFQGATAVALLFTGPLTDRLGVKWSNTFAVFTWSVAALFHGWANSLSQFLFCRLALGATEAMATPTNIKTVAAIFPPSMRSTGFGISNAASSIGAIFAPILIPLVAVPFGWRGAFVAAGLVGLIWSALWLLITRKIKFNDAVERAPADTAQKTTIFKDRATWTVAGAKVLSDATWWLMLFWAPDFLHRQFGVSGVALGPPLALAYVGAAVGSLVSGGIATALLVRGYRVNTVRKLVLLGSAVLVLPLPLALHAPNYWVAALMLALVLAAHQGFSTNLFALITDITPKTKIGRVTSFGSLCGNVGGVAVTKASGAVLAAGLGYLPLFLFASVSYLLALGWIQLLTPRIEPQEAAEE